MSSRGDRVNKKITRDSGKVINVRGEHRDHSRELEIVGATQQIRKTMALHQSNNSPPLKEGV